MRHFISENGNRLIFEAVIIDVEDGEYHFSMKEYITEEARNFYYDDEDIICFEVLAAIDDDSKHVVVQTAPATKVSLGEEFGMEPGASVGKKMVGALKAAGFDAVFDTCFSADLTIMEEARKASFF